MATQFPLETHEFKTPVKMLLQPDDVNAFFESAPCENLVGYIQTLQAAVKGKGRSQTTASERVSHVCELIAQLSTWVDSVEPIEQSMRFGNKAFAKYQQMVVEQGEALIVETLNKSTEGQALVARNIQLELKGYLEQSFGDPIRIDYGTGHELNFLCFMLVLTVTGYFTPDDFAGLVHHIFKDYVDLMRKIQAKYKLEPAGSHGVWGLDDYCFLPFLFGAAELSTHGSYIPDSIHDDSIVNREADEYLYFGSIKFIKEMKSHAHFGEHSPMLNDISAVPNWEKVSMGMIKMYKAEVLQKHPVMKHFLIGSIITYS